MDNKRLFSFSLAISGAIFFFGIALFLALASYVPGDVLYYPNPPAKIQNWCGIYGAQLASVLYLWLGYMAYGVPIYTIILAILLWRKINIQWLMWSLWWFGYAILWGCSFCCFWETMPISSPYLVSQGGILGLFIASYLQRLSTISQIIILGFTGIGILFWAISHIWEHRIQNHSVVN